MQKFGALAVGLGALGVSAIFATPAAAAAITFNYDCAIVNATTCTASANPFGTLTLTDSLIDTNRVDVDVILNGAAILALNPSFTGLNNFYVNYGGVLP